MILNKDNDNTERPSSTENSPLTKEPGESFMALVGISGAAVNFFLPQATWKWHQRQLPCSGRANVTPPLKHNNCRCWKMLLFQPGPKASWCVYVPVYILSICVCVYLCCCWSRELCQVQHVQWWDRPTYNVTWLFDSIFQPQPCLFWNVTASRFWLDVHWWEMCKTEGFFD